jgi:hypothetical protein
MGVKVANPKKNFSLTLNPNTIKYIRELAKKDNRSLSMYLDLLLTAYVEDIKKEGAECV